MVMSEWRPSRQDFILALEEERRKIRMFSRELPLSLQLINEAIDGLQRQMQSDEILGDKLDWLRSAQLWNPAAENELVSEEGTLRKPVAVNVRRVGKGFQPFERSKVAAFGCEGVEKDAEEDLSLLPAAAAAAQASRKQRRCWSPGLHRKFLRTLEQLGGSHAATPKQIRELMMVDGLTNDEVKSHLQKYRLHMRRPMVMVQSSNSNNSNNNSNNTQNQPHFVFVGNWAPPQEYASAAVATATAKAQPVEGSRTTLNGLYSPVASMPVEYELEEEEQPNKKQQTNKSPIMSSYSQQRISQDDDSLDDDAATLSNSSTTSFLSQTTSVPLSLSAR